MLRRFTLFEAGKMSLWGSKGRLPSKAAKTASSSLEHGGDSVNAQLSRRHLDVKMAVALMLQRRAQKGVRSPETENTTRGLAKRFSELHARGLAIVHVRTYLFERVHLFDDRRVLNNLRDEKQLINPENQPWVEDNYYYPPTLSATLLPHVHSQIGQNLYRCGYFFIGIDPEKCRITSFNLSDANASTFINKHGRPSYRAGSLPDISFKKDSTPYIEKLKLLAILNERSSKKPSRLNAFTELLRGQYDYSDQSFVRVCNEIVAKQNSDSLLCVGVTATALKNTPFVIVRLLVEHQLICEYTGIILPLYVYNNSSESIMLDFIAPTPVSISPNSFFELDPEFVLRNINEHPPKLPELLESEENAILCVVEKKLLMEKLPERREFIGSVVNIPKAF